MSEIPDDIKFRDSHEWIRDEEDGSFTVGISDHAQAALGDMVYIELPEVGTTFSQGDACAVVESVKAASDIYCPVAGEVLEINDALEDDPGLVNSEPYGAGWLFKLNVSELDELEELLDATEYAKAVEE
jgi:glycine cleavage system H protein